MLSALDRDTGILIFGRCMSIDQIAQMVQAMNDSMSGWSHEDILLCYRALQAEPTAQSRTNETLAFRRSIRSMSKAFRIPSRRESARAVLELVYSELSGSDLATMVNRSLNRIPGVVEYSCPGIVQAMEESAGIWRGIVRLLWESHRIVHSRSPPMEKYSFRRLIPDCLLQEFGLGRVICLPAFQRALVWRENTRRGIPVGWSDVTFQLIGVCLHPLLQRTGRGFIACPGEGLIVPFTPLRVGAVMMDREGLFNVILHGLVWQGVILRGPGSGSCRDRVAFDEAESIYRDGVFLAARGHPRGETLLFRAAARGHGGATWEAGAVCHLRREDGPALSWMRRAADLGHSWAMNELGHWFVQGDGVEVQGAEGLAYHRKAAELGHHESVFEVGRAFDRGQGEELNKKKAFAWWEKAAKHGNLAAMHNVGWMLLRGNGTGMDKAKGVSWLRMAAERGMKEAMWALAGVYSCGDGVDVSMAEARGWARKAQWTGEWTQPSARGGAR